MFAGIKGRGAQYWWYKTAWETECAAIQGRETTGATADIEKCFDQIQRPILYAVTRRAGFPDGVLRACSAFQERLQVRNDIQGDLGERYTKSSSIPQGCQMSMMLIAMLMVPWIRLVED